MPKAKATAKSKQKDDCHIPPLVPNAAINQFAFKRDPESDRIGEYVEVESNGEERVTFLEKVKTEHVMGIAHQCWNVHTDKGQWWVIDGYAANLYSQALFPSLDYLLSFHIGLMMRVDAKRTGTQDARLADRLGAAYRKWEQAAQALDESTESEEVQAAGMRCRETLLTFIRAVSDPTMVPAGTEIPKAGDFVRWSETVAGHVAQGSRNQRIRGYLKAAAKETWEVVNWLTHARDVTRIDGILAIDATKAVLDAFGAALIRHERQAPERCGKCGSLRLIPLYKPEIDADGAACLSCGWEFRPDDELEAAISPAN